MLGCSASAEDAGSEADNLSSTIHLPAKGSLQIPLNLTTTKDLTVTLDCHPPADPDEVGTVFGIEGSSLGVSAQTRAGFWQETLNVPAGKHSLSLTNQSAAAACSLKVVALGASATCRAWTAFRSPNTNHTHILVGTAAKDWEEFPASGNHWGSWAKWNTVYDKPIKRGFLLHNLEHGGLVLSYKCDSAASADCKDAQDQLVSLMQSLNDQRILVTPDPTQPMKFAIRAWRTAYESDCLDPTSAAAFARTWRHHGREDIDASPPIPFDPTSTNVPCQDLMAAPDSCN
jgi:hypothetical protein